MRPLVVHVMPNPVSALRFVDPMALALSDEGWDTEIWTEPGMGTDAFVPAIRARKRLIRANLTTNPIGACARLVTLWRLLRRAQPDCVHAHQTRGSLLPLIAARLAGVRFRVYHNHGSAYWGFGGVPKYLFGLLERLNCALATHVIFVNPALKELFEREGIARGSRSLLLGPGSACGIDLHSFDAFRDHEARRRSRAALGISEADFVALYVGRPYRRKGFDFLVDTWSSSVFSGPGNTLLLAGCTASDLSSLNVVKKAENIVPLGYRDEVRPLYAASDVVVLPSHHEGFNYALLEAAACERPIVATDIEGIRSFVSNGVEGLLHSRNDRQAFISSLQSLRAHTELRCRMGRAARARAETFDRRKILSALTDFYRRLR